MITFGIDVSLKTGWAVLSEDQLLGHGIVKVKPKDIHNRVLYLSKSINTLILCYKPDRIIIEDTFCGPNRKTYALLNKLHGGILSQIDENIPVYYVNPSAVRKAVMNKGNSSKEEVSKWIKKKFKLKSKYNLSLDESDAALLALYGLKIDL